MKKFVVVCLVAVFAICLADVLGINVDYAHASLSTNSNVPWVKAISVIAESIKGPVMFAIGILMFAAAVWGVIRGAELSSWVAPMAIMGLAVATAANADKVLTFIGVDGCMYITNLL